MHILIVSVFLVLASWIAPVSAQVTPQNVWVSSACIWGNSGMPNKSNPTVYCDFSVTDVVYPGYPPGVITWQGITEISHSQANFYHYNSLADVLMPRFAQSRESKPLEELGFTRSRHASCSPNGAFVTASIHSLLGDWQGNQTIGIDVNGNGYDDAFKDWGTGWSESHSSCGYQPPPVEEDDDMDPFLSWDFYPGNNSCSGTPQQYSSKGEFRMDLLEGPISYKVDPDAECEVSEEFAGNEPLYRGYYTANCTGIFELFYTIISMTGSGVDAYVAIDPVGVCTTLGPPQEYEEVW